MAVHETFTDNQALASLLGPPNTGYSGTWFGSVSIWSGQIIGYTATGNPVVEVQVNGIPGITAVQAEVYGNRTYDSTGLASVDVTMIEWSLPGSATILARYTFDSPVIFPLSVSRFAGIWQFVDILANGPTPQQLFADYSQNADTLIGGNAADTMDGGGNNDMIDGGGGADTLSGGDGNDSFVFRPGDAPAGEQIFGGSGTDYVLAIGSVTTGDIFQAGGVNLSSMNISSIEEIHLNGTEVIINAAQLGGFGFQTFVGRTGFADQLTIGNVPNLDLSAYSLINWELGVDRIAVIGTNGFDNVTGSFGDDVFMGQQGTDVFNGNNGDDRFIVNDNELSLSDQFFGGIGNDVLQVDSLAINSVQITPVTSLRNMTLDSVETLDVVKGSFAMDAADFIGAIGGVVGAPVTSTTGINHVMGNGNNGAPNMVLLEIHLGNLLGFDMRNIVFDNWNDGFYVDKTIRIVAGAQTQVIMCSNEETWVNGSASATGIYIGGGNSADEIYGSFQRDLIGGGNGDDYIVALNGDDVVNGGDGSDTVWGGDGLDTIGGGAGIDFLYGDLGDDRLVGNADNDVMNGGLGNDSLYGGLGADQHIGGDDAGIDLARYDDANYGNLTIRLDNSAMNVGAAAVGDTYIGMEGLVGGAGNDVIIGNGLVNHLHGSDGNDTLNGLAGADFLYGGNGNDMYTLAGDADIISDTSGIDTINSSITRNLASYTVIENLILSGTANINGIGNMLANRITGNAGNNTLNGALGNDTLIGGAGGDWFVFSTTLSATNIDRITDYSVADDTIRLDDAVFSGLALGILAAGAFATNMTGLAGDASDRIIYESDTGRVIFDADGLGGAAGIHFATLTAGLALTQADFVVF